MPTTLPFESLDLFSLSPARLRLWTLWHDHGGRPGLLDKVSTDPVFATNCIVFEYDGGPDLTATFIGEDVRGREASANQLPEPFTKVYAEGHRPFVLNLFSEMAGVPCGSEGYVERRMGGGQTPVRSRFLCLPIIESDGKVKRFISVDSGVTYKNAGDIPDETTLPPGFTRLTHTTLVTLS